MPTNRRAKFALIGAVPCIVLIAATLHAGQNPPASSAADGPIAQIVGTWRGHSECLVANSPCRDEVNVYRVAEIPGKPGIVLMTGSKVVQGREVVMGSGEWKYDVEKHVLSNESSVGTVRHTVDGNKMEGELTLKDKTVYRRIHLKKES